MRINAIPEASARSIASELQGIGDNERWLEILRGKYSKKVEGEDLQTAAVRKLVEMKKETGERAARDPARYGKFSERIQKLIEQFQQGLIEASEVMNQTKQTAEAVRQGDSAYEQSGLSEPAYDLFKILQRFKVDEAEAAVAGTAVA